MFVENKVGNVIIIVGIVLVAIAIVTFSILLALRGSKKKQVRVIEKKFQNLRNVLTGQDAQYLHRLESISRNNLEYTQIFERFSLEFRGLLEGDCKYCENHFAQLKAMIEKNDSKNFKVIFSETKKAMIQFKDKLGLFDKNLHETIKPEEDCRSSAIDTKEQYRLCKERYYQCEKQLELVSESFNKVFNKVDKTFEEFEVLLGNANYKDAIHLLPPIKQVLTQLIKIMEDLPGLCVQVEQILPSRINEVLDCSKQMLNSGTPIFNLSIDSKQSKRAYQLSECRDRLKEFKIGNVKTELVNVAKEVEDLQHDLDKELADKAFFEENCTSVYQNVVNVEKTFLKIVSKLPEINEVYVVDPAQADAVEKQKDNLNALGEAKRELDNFIHGSAKQPYSVLRNKLEELKKDYEVIQEGIDSFKSYLDSLRTTSENAFKQVYDYYYHLRSLESKLREMNIVGYKELYDKRINELYFMLGDLDSVVRTKPIDINIVNEKVNKINEFSAVLFKQIEENYKNMKLAESAIIFNNRDRIHQNDIHEKLKILEGQFFNGEFSRVYQQANELFRNNHVEDSGNVR